MTKRSLILIAALLLATCVFAISIQPITVTTPISSAQLGAFYSSTITASGGFGAPFTFAVTSGALPTGLTLNGNTGAITGIPTQIGTFTFTITATDSQNAGVASPAERRRTVSQAAPPAASGSAPFSITVGPGVGGASGAPISPFALLLAALGMALVGIYQLRRMRQRA